jgi:hypothetical protein
MVSTEGMENGLGGTARLLQKLERLGVTFQDADSDLEKLRKEGFAKISEVREWRSMLLSQVPSQEALLDELLPGFSDGTE